MIPRSRLWCIIVLIGFLGACAAPPSGMVSTPTGLSAPAATGTPGLTSVSACYSQKSATQASIWYALEKGIFRKYGLDVDLVSIGGGAKAAAALISQDVDFCTMASPSVVNAVVAGEDLVLTSGFYDRNIYYIIVAPDIRSPADLIGKKIGTGLPGGAQNTMSRIGIASLGLEPDKDVDIVGFAEESERIAALESGQVAGVTIHPPVSFTLQDRGYKVLLDLSTLDVAYQGAGVVTRRSIIKDHRDTVLRFNQAIWAAILAMKQDQPGALEVIAKYLDYDPVSDRALLEKTYQALIAHNLLELPLPNLPGIQVVLDEAALENPAAARFKPEDMIDLSILEELQMGGFPESMP